MHNEFYDVNVRIENMWPFPCMNPSESLVEAFEFPKDLPDVLKEVINSCDWIKEAFDEAREYEAVEELSSEMFYRGCYGFIAALATPVYTRTGDNSHSFSWGHYHTKIVFASDMENLTRQALEWEKEVHDDT